MAFHFFLFSHLWYSYEEVKKYLIVGESTKPDFHEIKLFIPLDIEKMKLCDSYVKDFELCISKKNSTVEDIRKSFFILVSCEIKHGLYIKKE